jgi:hypothetical protein
MSTRQLITCAWILLLSALFSCSDAEDESIVPNYAGTWERTWLDDEQEINFRQILTVEENKFNSKVYIIENNSSSLHFDFNGKHEVIDNTLKAWIIKLGVAENENSITYWEKTNDNFDNIVLNQLKIHSDFIGTYFVHNETLTLRLDLDGDGSVTGDEGLFEFELSKDY